MRKDEQISFLIKKKELWIKGNNCFNESARLMQDLEVYVSSTRKRIEALNNEGKKYLDEMQELAQELDKLELE